MSASQDGKQFVKSCGWHIVWFVLGIIIGATNFHNDVKHKAQELGAVAYDKFMPDNVKEILE